MATLTPAYPTLWDTWNINYSTTSSMYVDNKIWLKWNECSSTATTATTYMSPATWRYWNNSAFSNSYAMPTPLTEEQRAEQRAAAERRRVEQAAATAKRVEEERFAKERAEKLLLEHLSEEQRKEWVTSRQFHLHSQSGRRYCIKAGRQHNVFEVDANGRRLKELCGHVRDVVPNEDNVLAQKLALELMEADFLKTCNIWDLTALNRPVISRSGEGLLAVA